MIKQCETYGRHPLFEDERGRTFWRIMGGIAWPGAAPGFIVIVGEEAKGRPDPPYHLHVLAEAEERNPARLIRKALELGSTCLARNFYGYVRSPADMGFLGLYNRKAMEAKEPQLNIHEAPHAETPVIHFHANLILTRVSPGEKTLHFSAQSSLSGRLLELQEHDLSTARAGEYPAIAALGYVVAEMSVHEYQYVDERESSDKDWDPRDY